MIPIIIFGLNIGLNTNSQIILLSDARNITSQKAENLNKSADKATSVEQSELQKLIHLKLLKLVHVAGITNVCDQLTKTIRESNKQLTQFLMRQ